ncbi:MAG: N-ethylammeline chlorohydrolase, partial [Clostridia bacterium]|nr:N-ethylammeline chlorohydrolase [Clostridia bacterium]
PAQAFAAATTVGARAMGYDRLGLLKPGYLADLVLVDLHTPNAAPLNDLENDLIYAVQGSDVRMTMVNGRVLYKDGRFTTLDPKAVVRRAEHEAREIERKTALGN